MQTNRIQRCTGLLCAAVFAVAALSGTASPSVRAAASGENVTGDLLEMQGIPLDADAAAAQTERIPVYGADNSTATAYAEDRYASHAGYDTLSDEQKQLYNAMKQAAHTFYVGSADAESVSYSTGTMDCCVAVDTGSQSLNKEDVVRVISMFRNDNPVYFFLGSSCTARIMISGQGKVILIWFIFPVQRTAPTAQSGRRSERFWKTRS